MEQTALATSTAATPSAAEAATHAAKVIARGAALGALIVFALITGICLSNGLTPAESMAIAAMPAIFGGPLVAGLFIMAEYHKYEQQQGHA